jgi:hypothetical protein
MLRLSLLPASMPSETRAGQRRREMETELNYLVSLVALLAVVLALACYGNGSRRLRRHRG